MKTIDEYVKEKNEIQLIAENTSEKMAQECWVRLVVANRNIDRVVGGRLTLTEAVAAEIEKCLQDCDAWLKEKTKK